MIVNVSRGANDISQERLRQIASEGYDAAHDDEHSTGDIAVVAAELALAHTTALLDHDRASTPCDQWGLLKNHKDTRRRLVIAGALIAAEIDRLDRQTSRGGRRGMK
jgi:hypothetical protein